MVCTLQFEKSCNKGAPLQIPNFKFTANNSWTEHRAHETMARGSLKPQGKNLYLWRGGDKNHGERDIYFLQIRKYIY